jgi:hypothetical protein
VLLNGQIAYNIGDVDVRNPGDSPAFAQLWTLTAEEANAASTAAAETAVRPTRVVPVEEVLTFLRTLIRRHNSLARTLLTAREQIEREEERLRELGEEVLFFFILSSCNGYYAQMPRFRLSILNHRQRPNEVCMVIPRGHEAEYGNANGIWLQLDRRTRPTTINLWNSNRDWLVYTV